MASSQKLGGRQGSARRRNVSDNVDSSPQSDTRGTADLVNSWNSVLSESNPSFDLTYRKSDHISTPPSNIFIYRKCSDSTSANES